MSKDAVEELLEYLKSRSPNLTDEQLQYCRILLTKVVDAGYNAVNLAFADVDHLTKDPPGLSAPDANLIVTLVRAGPGMTPAQYLAQPLPTLFFLRTTSPSTAKYPNPTWAIEVWKLNRVDMMAVIQREVARAVSGVGEQPLRELQGSNVHDRVQSEAGVKALFNPALMGVSSVLRSTGHPRCAWVLEGTAASADKSARVSKQRLDSAGGGSTVEVQGFLGKKPDFELFDGADFIRSFFEFKVPSLLDAAEAASLASLDREAKRAVGRPPKSAIPIVPGAILDDIFGQVESYCRVRKVRFFALSTYRYTWLCYVKDQRMYISEGFAWNTTEPTVLQALFWLSLKALGDDGSLSDAEVVQPPVVGGVQPSCPSGAGSNSKEGNESSAESSSSQSHGGLASADDGSPSTTESVSVVCVPGDEVVLGTGMTGPVYAGSLDGVPVAVKWTEAGSSMAKMLEHEAAMLQLVQGPFTPRVVFVGLSACGRWFMLLTSRVFGRTLEEEDSQLLPDALAALRAVHAARLHHGDIRLQNFMLDSGSQTPGYGTVLHEGEEGRRVIILDLGRAKLCRSDEEDKWEQLKLEEEEQLCALFWRGRPGDGGVLEGSLGSPCTSPRGSSVRADSGVGRHAANHTAAVTGQLVNRRRSTLVPSPKPGHPVQLCPRLRRSVGPKPLARLGLNRFI